MLRRSSSILVVLLFVLATFARGASAQAPPSPGDVTILVFTDPGEIPHLEVAGEARKLPLKHTDVRANVRGGVAEVAVTQTYENPSDKPIEARYIFPLPENSAVYSMRMTIGERVVEAVVREREEAKRTYEAAKQAGHAAALLEQERPNVFTQSVANIEPGKRIEVTIRYVQDLTYDAGKYEFVFPMVVGPRFMNGNVPDAARISPPVMGKGERTGSDVKVEVNVDPAPADADVEVPTHEIVKKRADGALYISLAEKSSIPNRDFVLRWRVAGDKPKSRLLLSEPVGGVGYFSLLVHPPDLPVDSLVGRRQVIFVVDVSGSMFGVPLALCKRAMREALLSLRPVDTFNIVTFAGSTGQAFPSPRAVNHASIRDAWQYVAAMTAGGGTQMAGAVEAALRPEIEPGRDRYVFFLTDGFIGGETEIFEGAKRLVAGLRAKGQKARVFGMGIGSSPNRNLIEGLSKAGNGLATYAGNREDPARAINAVYHHIDHVVLTDVKPDLAALGAEEVFPAKVPDLFASHPLVLHGTYRKPPAGPIVVKAKAGNEAIEIPVEVRRTSGDSGATLGRLWARSKVASLEELLWEGPVPNVQSQIVELGVRFHLVTPYTSLVAVDWSRKVGDGNPETITQPVESPEGVDSEMAGAQMASYGHSMSGSAEEIVVMGRPGSCLCHAGAGDETRGGVMSVGLIVIGIVVRRWRRRGVRPSRD
jgi:Ca-activated chloride channel homolog